MISSRLSKPLLVPEGSDESLRVSASRPAAMKPHVSNAPIDPRKVPPMTHISIKGKSLIQ